MIVQESQVEDILATYPNITQRVLGIDRDLSLLARQKKIVSGRLDLLFASNNKLLLLELKVEDFKPKFVDQVLGYRSDLLSLQESGMLLDGLIETYLLCPNFSLHGLKLCNNHDITTIEYSPTEVLQEFFDNVKAGSPFLTLKPMDSGLWNIHLINRALYALAHINDIEMIAKKINLSIKTVSNHLRFAEQLQLVKRDSGKAFLTTLGKQYVLNRDQSLSIDTISFQQAEVIQDFILENPFSSPTIFGIYLIVETTFNLTRNVYPVPLDMVLPHFRDASGKRYEWESEKSIYHGTRMYSNYAIELGLLAKAGNKLLVTPKGIQFILLLQLHKGIRMINTRVNRY